MGFISRIRNSILGPRAWSRRSGGRNVEAAKAREANDPARQNGAALHLRRWDSAKTTRLNSGHWGSVVDTQINADLAAHLATLRARCSWEIANNPMMAGVVETYAGDLVGPTGPVLQVQSSSKEYNIWLERHWRVWWKSPDLAGILSGPDMLQLWARQLWPCGEFLAQFTTDANAATPLGLRLNNIHARRLTDPMTASLKDSSEIVLGVERDLFGKPIKYWVSKESIENGVVITETDVQPIPAAEMIHGFRKDEPDQARGIPWAATQLQNAADTRDFSDQVMDAARSAADTGVTWYADDPDIPAMTINDGETWEIERRQNTTGPAGWKPFQVHPEQPGTTYFEFMKERYRELGRPVGMPLMMVLLDSQGINYSGGRLDTQSYDRGLMVNRAAILEPPLDRMTARVEQEAELADRKAGNKVPKRPDDVRIVWGWTPRPHVDPVKEAMAIDKMMKAGVYTVAKGLSLTTGQDIDAHIAALEKEIELFEAAGLTHPAKANASPGLANAPAPASATAVPAKPADNSAPVGGPKAKDKDDGS